MPIFIYIFTIVCFYLSKRTKNTKLQTSYSKTSNLKIGLKLCVFYSLWKLKANNGKQIQSKQQRQRQTLTINLISRKCRKSEYLFIKFPWGLLQKHSAELFTEYMLFLFYFRLLDILAGRKDPKGLRGHVLIDGQVQPAYFKCMSGYVSQVWYQDMASINLSIDSYLLLK